MPSDPVFWQNRWNWARVDYELSFGVFEGEQLVAFIINGIDQHNGKRTAFNTGTGVIKNFRGQQLVDKMYAAALPHFQKAGIEKYLLEVFVNNERAIRVYERIGFKKIRRLKCYKGKLQSGTNAVQVQ